MDGLSILNCSPMSDTAGNGIRTKRAFDRLRPTWRYRTTCRTTNYIAYPQDLPWSDALAAWRAADVVHVRDGFRAEAMLRAPRRPTVIHHHGTQFRLHWRDLLPEQRRRGAIGLAATLDLYLMAPDDLEWMPALYDLDWLARIRDETLQVDNRVSGTLRIAHAPTNRVGKSTEAFLAACARLARELPVEVILIERSPWADTLARKATADIYFDQAKVGYGNNAIEAWGMGIPVIAGAADATLVEMGRRFGTIPFEVAEDSADGIYHALRHLADDENRAAAMVRGLLFVERFHGAEPVVGWLADVYTRAATSARGQAMTGRRPATVADVASPQKGRSPVATYDQTAYWLERGKTYEERFRLTPQHRASQEALIDVIADLNLPAKARILEVACGFGRIGKLLVARFARPDYVGIELSPDLAKSAAYHLTGHELVDGVAVKESRGASARSGRTVEVRHVALEDASQDLERESFDVVVAAEFLMHVPPADVAAAVDALAEFVKPGGSLVTLDWDEPTPPARIAAHNFLHDYRTLFGSSDRRTVVGRQTIRVMRRGRSSSSS